MSFDPREIDRLLAEDGQAPVDSRVRSLLRTLRDDLRRPLPDEVAERHLARIFEAARNAPERLTLRVRAAHFMTRLMAATTVKVVVGATAAVAATSGIAATVNVPDPVQQIANVVVRTIVPLPSEDTRLARDAVIIAEEPRTARLPEAAPEPETEPAPELRGAATPTKSKTEAVAEEDDPVEEESLEQESADDPMDDFDDEPRSDFCPTDPWDEDEGLEEGAEEAGEDDTATDEEGEEAGSEEDDGEGDDLCYVDGTADDDEADDTTSAPGRSGGSRQGQGPRSSQDTDG